MNQSDTTKENPSPTSSPTNSDPDYVVIKSPPTQDDIWEKFEKQQKQTQEELMKTKQMLEEMKSQSFKKEEAKMSVEMKKLEEENRSLKQQLEISHSEFNKSKEENQSLKQQLKLKEEVTTGVSEIEKMKKEIQSLKKTNKSLSDRVVKSNTELFLLCNERKLNIELKAKIEAELKSKEATELIKWKPVKDGKLGSDAVAGGNDGLCNITYVGRALYDGNLFPGKIVEDLGYFSCSVVWKSQEVRLNEFEYLTKPTFGTLTWKLANNGRVPGGAVIAGKTSDGELLFVGRANIENSLIIGKLQPSRFGLLSANYLGATRNSEYEVLCHIYE